MFSVLFVQRRLHPVNCACFSVFYTGCTSGVYLSFPAAQASRHLSVADACAYCRLGLQLFNEAQRHGIREVLSVGTSLWAQKITSGKEKHWDFHAEQSRRPDIRPDPRLNGHLLQLVGCSCYSFIRRDLMAVLLAT